MRVPLINPPRPVIVLFHLARYFIAGCITGFALIIFPLASIIVLASLIALLLILVWAAFLFGSPLDGGALQAIFWFVAAPMMLLLSTIVSVILTLLLAAIYIMISALPCSFLVELVSGCFADQRFSVGSVPARLASFAAVGIVPGIVAGSIGFLLVQPETLLEMGAIYFGAVLISVCTVFLFGMTLTLLLAIKEGTLALWRRLVDF